MTVQRQCSTSASFDLKPRALRTYRLQFRATRELLKIAAILFVAVSVLPTRAGAQWVKSTKLPAGVVSIKFFHEFGEPQNGVIGLRNGQIWRTTNSGTTWQSCSSPSIRSITSFTFKSKDKGWCSVRGDGTIDAVMTTNDGGLNWAFQSTRGNGSCIYYHPPVDRLYLQMWTGMPCVGSADEGVTWQQTGMPPNQNGIAFNDDNNGISATLNNQFYRTFDAGMSWRPITMDFRREVWQPMAVKGTTTYFATSESTRIFSRSDDGGDTWIDQYFFPTTIAPTGMSDGDFNFVLIQTRNAGFLASTDQGKSWLDLCGPNNFSDTRFFLDLPTNTAWAGDDTGGVWVNRAIKLLPDYRSVQIVPPVLELFTTDCKETRGSFKLTAGGECPVTRIMAIEPTGRTAELKVTPRSYPVIINGSDSVQVVYTPKGSSPDTLKVRLRYNLGIVERDTIMTVIAHSEPVINVAVRSGFYQMRSPTCLVKDTLVPVVNRSCDTVTLKNVTLTGNPGITFEGPTLPRDIAPGDTLWLTFSATATWPGDIAAFASLTLNSRTLTKDIRIDFALNTSASKPIENTGSTLNAKDICTAFDSSISFSNNLCDTLHLTELLLEDSSIFQLIPGQLPVDIPPGQSITLRVHAGADKPGTYKTIAIATLIGGYAGASQTFIDTTSLKLVVSSAAPINTAYLPSAPDFGTIGLCKSGEIQMKVVNRSCKNLTLSKVYPLAVLEPFSIGSEPLPVTVLPGDTTVITIRFDPSVAGSFKRFFVVRYDVDGFVREDTILVSGKSSREGSAGLTVPLLDFANVSLCTDSVLFCYAVNNTCDSLLFTDLRLSDTRNFMVLAPIQAVWLGVGDSILIRVRYKGIAGGKATANVDLNFKDKSNVEQSLILPLDAFGVEPERKLFVESLQLPVIRRCSNFDTSFIVVNRSECSSLRVDNVDLSDNLWLSVAPQQALPVTLAPGDTLRVAVRVTPDAEGPHTTTVTIAGELAASGLISGSIIAPVTELTASLSALEYEAPLCKSTRGFITLTASSCDSLVLDDLAISSLTGVSRFLLPTGKVVLPPAGSITIPIEYVADAVGDSLATLTIRCDAAGFLATYSLVGKTTGERGAIAVRPIFAGGAATASVDAASLTSFAIVASEARGMTDAIADMRFVISYNADVVNLSSLLAATGWDPSYIEDQPGTIRLHLSRVAAGPINAGDTLAVLTIFTSLSDTTASEIAVSGLEINNNDAEFGKCVMTTAGTGQPLTLNVNTICGDNVIVAGLRGSRALRILSLRPNPVGGVPGDAQLELLLDSRQAGSIGLRVFDAQGNRLLERHDVPLESGSSTITIGLTDLPEGTYFVVVDGFGFRDVRKVIVVKK